MGDARFVGTTGHGKWGILHFDPEPLLDPDCRDGKHASCVGPPCECPCHTKKEPAP